MLGLPPDHSVAGTCPIARRGSPRSAGLVEHAAQLRIRWTDETQACSLEGGLP
jgi:hypothetical protein